ncbi:hypothetical protein [Vitreimonas flagellata]|uniref:hypothetical protein n=1 Tax=Vitreimonas flagellata TaxID=2560861 RepID=UPI0010758B54|nr:hypothetical protein [Vitreimonas flagellata]
MTTQSFDHGVKHFDAYIGFITVVLGDAPDRWIREDFLTEEQQLNLERAFEILRTKFHLVEERLERRSAAPKILETLERCYAAYKAGDGRQGAFLIQDFEELILKNTRR